MMSLNLTSSQLAANDSNYLYCSNQNFSANILGCVVLRVLSPMLFLVYTGKLLLNYKLMMRYREKPVVRRWTINNSPVNHSRRGKDRLWSTKWRMVGGVCCVLLHSLGFFFAFEVDTTIGIVTLLLYTGLFISVVESNYFAAIASSYRRNQSSVSTSFTKYAMLFRVVTHLLQLYPIGKLLFSTSDEMLVELLKDTAIVLGAGFSAGFSVSIYKRGKVLLGAMVFFLRHVHQTATSARSVHSNLITAKRSLKHHATNLVIQLYYILFSIGLYVLLSQQRTYLAFHLVTFHQATGGILIALSGFVEHKKILLRIEARNIAANIQLPSALSTNVRSSLMNSRLSTTAGVARGATGNSRVSDAKSLGLCNEY